MLQPSQAHLWVPCSLAGNVLASGEYPATPQPLTEVTDSRREGTCAAWAAELLITGAVDHPRELIDMQHPNGWVIDREMAHHVADYRDYCSQWGPVSAAEVPIELFGGLVRGRLDSTTALTGVLRVFDLKYGWRPVEARENWTMLCYGLARAAEFAEAACTIELHIFQPRPHHPDGPARVWRIEAHEVDGWMQWLWAVATEARDNPRASPGQHCDRCPAQASCVANAKTGYHLYQSQAERRMHGHTPAEIARELVFVEMAEDFLASRRKALEVEAMARLAVGEDVPGCVREPRLARERQFTVPAETVELITGRPMTHLVEQKKTPAELEREGVPKHVVKMITHRPTVGWKLGRNPEGLADRIFGKAK